MAHRVYLDRPSTETDHPEFAFTKQDSRLVIVTAYNSVIGVGVTEEGRYQPLLTLSYEQARHMITALQMALDTR